MFYILIIAISMILIIGINVLLVFLGCIDSFSYLYAILAPIFNLIVIVLWELAIAGIIHAFPAKYFSPYSKRFKIFDFERGLYEKSGIRKWKDYIPDSGQLCDFKKDELKSTEVEYLHKFLVEACYADAIHLWMGIGGFLILLISIPYPVALWTISFPIAFISLLLNIPPLIIQRYNRPKLLKVYERMLKKEKKSS